MGKGFVSITRYHDASTVVAAKTNFVVKFTHIPGVSNTLADSLSSAGPKVQATSL